MHIAQNWRIRQSRYAMQGVRCEKCGTILFPARAVCPHCEESHQSVSTPSAEISHTDHEILTRQSFDGTASESLSGFAQAAR